MSEATSTELSRYWAHLRKAREAWLHQGFANEEADESIEWRLNVRKDGRDLEESVFDGRCEWDLVRWCFILFRWAENGLRLKHALHPAKAVAPMQACALHLRDRIDSLRSPFAHPSGSLRLSNSASLRFQNAGAFAWVLACCC